MPHVNYPDSGRSLTKLNYEMTSCVQQIHLQLHDSGQHNTGQPNIKVGQLELSSLVLQLTLALSTPNFFGAGY